MTLDPTKFSSSGKRYFLLSVHKCFAS